MEMTKYQAQLHYMKVISKERFLEESKIPGVYKQYVSELVETGFLRLINGRYLPYYVN